MSSPGQAPIVHNAAAADSVPAVVMDASYRMALAVIRALGGAGVPVVAVERQGIPPRYVLGFWSRYTRARCLVPSPRERDGRALLESLDDVLRRVQAGAAGEVAAVRKRQPWVLVPVTLPSVIWAARFSGELGRLGVSGVRVALPSPERILRADNTDALLPLAEAAGVAVPRTFRPPSQVGREGQARQGQADVEEWARSLPYPLIVKYRQADAIWPPVAVRYRVVCSPAELVAAYLEMDGRQPDPLVQEFIAGEGYGVSAVIDGEGRPVSLFCHHRLREYPVGGGPSTFCESVWDPHLAELGLAVLRALDWFGLAMVEFRRDRQGEYRLLEVNPRFWGSLPLALSAGTNPPLALYQAARGERLPEVKIEKQPPYRVGVRLRFLLSDLRAAPGYARQTAQPWRWWLRYAGELLDPRIKDGVLSFSDPLPGLLYLLRAAASAGG